MRLIDANVFIYAVGQPHEWRDPSQRVLARVAEGVLAANTDIEVLQEILHFYRARHEIELGRVVFEKTADAFPRPLMVDLQALRTAAGILERHPHLQARDAVHAAVVIDQRLEGIISADRGFDGIAGVKRFDPREML